MLENLLNYLVILDKGDDPHPALAHGTRQWVHFIYFLDKARPIFTVPLFAEAIQHVVVIIF